MLEEIEFLHAKITTDECIRVVLIRNDWEIYIDRTDLLYTGDGLLRIVRANGNITTVNPSAIAVVCTMPKKVII